MTPNGLYAQISVAMPRDPAMIEAGPMAELLYVRIVLYSRENLTDGAVHNSVLPIVGRGIRGVNAARNRLIAAGLLHETDTGVQIPRTTWTKWNPTKADVDSYRASKSKAGTRGNHQRWHRFKPSEECPYCVEDGSQTDRTSDNGANRKRSPETETETETETTTSSQSRFLQEVVHRLADRLTEEHPPKRNPDAHRARILDDLTERYSEQIQRTIHAWPNATPDAIAAELEREGL